MERLGPDAGEKTRSASPPPHLGLAKEAKADTGSTESPERTKAAMFEKKICPLEKNLSKSFIWGDPES